MTLPRPRLRNGTLHALAAMSLLALPLAMHAQDMPMVDAVGAYNHANVMQHRGEQKRAPAPAAGSLTRRQFDALTARLRTEHAQRVKRDGRPAADRWLRARVAQLRARYTHIRD